MTWPQQPQYDPQQQYPPQQYQQQQYHQQQHPQQQYQPQQAGPGGQTAIAITAKYMWLAFMLAMIKPKLFVNGHEVAGAWGRNVVPVQPGQHHLHMHVPYFLPPRIGPADLPVPVHPGQTVELEYRAPIFGFSAGSLGPPPQQYKGVGVTIGIFGGILVIGLVCCLFSVVASAAGA